MALKCSAPAVAQHLSSSRIFFLWGWDRGDGESGGGDLSGSAMGTLKVSL